MSLRRLLPAFLVALCISGLFTWWLARRISRPRGVVATPMRRLVAVTRNLQAGEQLDPALLHLVDWPAAQPLAGALEKPADAAGRTLLFPLSAGELVLSHQLAAPGAGLGLTGRIPEGMRAISLHSDEVTGVAGFLLPGSFVDVLVTYRAGNSPDMTSSTVLQDARVLAVGQKSEPDPDGKPSTADAVTLLVSPQDAEKLSLANSLGKIVFVLRNAADRTVVAGLSPQLLSFGNAVPQVPAQAAPPRLPTPAQPVARPASDTFTIQTILGTKQREETFEEVKKP